jgi:hypothetical protein
VKSEYRRKATVLPRGMDGRVNHRLMAEMHTIKHAHGQMQRAADGPYILQ